MRRGSSWRRVTLLFCAQAVFGATSRFFPLVPFIQSGFSLAPAAVGFLTMAFFGGQAVGSIPVGWAVSRLGALPAFVAGITLLGGLWLLAAAVPTYWALLLVLAMAGAVFSAGHIVTNQGVLDWFPRQQRGMVIGVKQCGITVAATVNAMVLPAVALLTGWRPAAAWFGLTVMALGWTLAWCWRREGAGTVRTAAPRPASPTTATRPARTGAGLIGLAAAVLSATQFSVSTYLLLYLHDHMGMPILAATGLLAIAEVMGTIGRIGWGLVSDRILGGRREPVLWLIVTLAIAGTAGLALLPAGGPRWPAILAIVALGLSAYGFAGIWMLMAAESGGRTAGVTTGVSLTLGSLGSVCGPPLLGGLVQASGSYRTGFAGLTALLVLVALVLWRDWARRGDTCPAYGDFRPETTQQGGA